MHTPSRQLVRESRVEETDLKGPCSHIIHTQGPKRVHILLHWMPAVYHIATWTLVEVVVEPSHRQA